MSISLSLTVDDLKKPGTARALADLILALGQAVDSEAAARRRIFTAPYADTSRPLAVAPPATASVGAAVVSVLGDDGAEEAPSNGYALDEDDDSRFRDFVAALPERSKDFLALVQSRGTITINDAMDALGIKVPKAMGGITGSIARWAPLRGVELPYETVTNSKGERVWRWIRQRPVPIVRGEDRAAAALRLAPRKVRRRRKLETMQVPAESQERPPIRGVRRRRGKVVTTL